MQHQYSLQLIPHQVGSSIINQRHSDGYINATALCNAAGKKFNDYRHLESTSNFLAELSSGNIVVKGNQELIEVRPGSPETGGDSWVHPHVAIHLAQWLSEKFAVQVSKWVSDWMTGKGSPNIGATSVPFQ